MDYGRQCWCEYDHVNMRVQHKPTCPYGEASVSEAVQSQIDGEPLFVSPEKDPRLEKMVQEFFEIFERSYEQAEQEKKAKSSEETNFGFYVDGYTLQSTEVVGEIQVTSYDGRMMKFPSKQLVAFLERRLSPSNHPEN